MRLRKRWVRILLLLALVVVLGVAGVWLLLRSDPGWYRPIAVDPVAHERELRSAQDEIAQLTNNVTRAKANEKPNVAMPAFDVEFTETQINGLIAKWRDFGPVADALREIQEPQVRLFDGRIILAGRAGEKGPLISIELSVEQTAKGPEVTLGRPWAGRLPLSRSLLEKLAGGADGALRENNVPPAAINTLQQLLAGETLPQPMIVLPSNVRDQPKIVPAKVEALTITDGLLKATLRPIATE